MNGLGYNIFMLSGGSKHSSEEYVGKTVKNAVIEDSVLLVDFEDGTKISIFDGGQSCCELRYMTCDDDPTALIGGIWVSAQVQDGPSVQGKDNPYSEDHDQQFLIVQSTTGTITIANHNEHNGYYGGFGMMISERK